MAINLECLRGQMAPELLSALEDYVNPVSYDDKSGTPGNCTSNTATGRCAVANGASTVVVTNSLCSATSVVFAVKEETDAAVISKIVPTDGSFTITLSTTASSDVTVSWAIMGAR